MFRWCFHDARLLPLTQRSISHFTFSICIGKGGGYVPGKGKVPLVTDDALMDTRCSRAVPILVVEDTNANETDAPTQEGTSLSFSSGVRLKIFMVFYSMYGHMEGGEEVEERCERHGKIGRSLYRALEILLIKVLNQM
ncbi:NAD(P)H dehydrogenase (quinone) FQR 2 [Spatholobus suberectus]|nr:NAD(P)H dehydrogenase (quinone) FQR 2 [Spatholobus suberectus]